MLQRHQLPRRLLRAKSVLCHIQTWATEPGEGSRDAKEKFKAGVIWSRAAFGLAGISDSREFTVSSRRYYTFVRLLLSPMEDKSPRYLSKAKSTSRLRWKQPDKGLPEMAPEASAPRASGKWPVPGWGFPHEIYYLSQRTTRSTISFSGVQELNEKKIRRLWKHPKRGVPWVLFTVCISLNKDIYFLYSKVRTVMV